MKKFKVLLLFAAMMFALTGCQGISNAVAEEPSEETVPVLEGHDLMIYCGAGMTNPFEEITQLYKDKTGCEMNVTYANAGQIQSQINTAQEGDLFIAASADELVPVQDVVTRSENLVLHIPVLAVQKGNPLNITGLSDLVRDDIRMVLGDGESVPVGKIANKALADAQIAGQVNVVATLTTAPALATALESDEADATIIWKENAKSLSIVESPEMDKYIKTVVAASLEYSQDDEAVENFLEFLDSDDAKNIWTKNGYEIAE
ncbi:molybdate ABC transporter substrate-binding protein [Parasporobacterium paucivorans]|uniref:Molybdate transport system substrate-binding protein n=1 Tax=Parasporobacterium paucivorans DSM 15970 TaxID=1122934 RepID=A0A1M6I583_9FIRM|nr:molybdate ABC transporter substrate-binding protein [Parasporobacterium paucivorans]SHJ29626.1 molybdate transport system substrate-binding protein [Parasporobacterium paucivorans DSM 15970]